MYEWQLEDGRTVKLVGKEVLIWDAGKHVCTLNHFLDMAAACLWLSSWMKLDVSQVKGIGA